MKAFYKTLRFWAVAITTLLLTSACDSDLFEFKDENKGSYLPNANSEPIATYMDSQEQYAEWVHVLNYANLYSSLNQASGGTVFTVFAPSNEAVQNFYKEKGVESIEQLGVDYAKALVRTHTHLGDSVKFVDKFTNTTTAIGIENKAGETLIVSVDSVRDGFLINHKAHFDRDYTKTANGFVYEVDQLLTPLIETVYDRIAQKPEYSLMTDALKATGYDEILQKKADTTYTLGKMNITHYSYTFLTVANNAFAQAGINNVADLKRCLSERTPEENADSLLKRYIEYHLQKVPYIIEEFQEMIGTDTLRVWQTAAPNEIFTVSACDPYQTTEIIEGIDSLVTRFAHYYINQPDLPTEFVAKNSNVLAKNGYVHEVSTWMPMYKPQQSTVVWDLADYAEVSEAAGMFYRPSSYSSAETKINCSGLKCYEYEVGPEGSANSSYYPISYVTCKSNLKNCLNYDRMVFNLGYQGSVAMKTPTLVQGKYKVTITMAYLTDQSFIRTMNGSKGGMIKCTFDDENTKIASPYTTITKSLAGVYEATLYDEIEFDTTASHTFKFVVMDPAASTNNKFSLQFDCITFTPIIDGE